MECAQSSEIERLKEELEAKEEEKVKKRVVREVLNINPLLRIATNAGYSATQKQRAQNWDWATKDTAESADSKVTVLGTAQSTDLLVKALLRNLEKEENRKNRKMVMVMSLQRKQQESQ